MLTLDNGRDLDVLVKLVTDRLTKKFEKCCTGKVCCDNTGAGNISVGLALPESVFNVSGSPVTSVGTLTGIFIPQLANTVFAGPATGVNGIPTFRALTLADLPPLPVPDTDVPISSLLPAIATNTINNLNFIQDWQWNTLAGTALQLSANSTAAAGNAQKVLAVNTTGVNAVSNQTTYGITVANTHSGVNSRNIGIDVSVSGGTDGINSNIAGIFTAPSGATGFAPVVSFRNGGGAKLDFNVHTTDSYAIPSGNKLIVTKGFSLFASIHEQGNMYFGASNVGLTTAEPRIAFEGVANTTTRGRFDGTSSAVATDTQNYANIVFGGNHVQIGTETTAGFTTNVLIKKQNIFQEDLSVVTNHASLYVEGDHNLTNPGAIGASFVNSYAVYVADGRVCVGAPGMSVLSAKLSVNSTTQGFLPPRMTTAQKNAIVSPATGLHVFDTSLNVPCYFDGAIWVCGWSGGGGGLSDGDKGDITVTAGGLTWTIDNDVVNFAKMQNIATSRFIGRISGGSGDPEELSGTQATTLLDVFTSGLKGLAPASGGGTDNFLRADGTWALPPTFPLTGFYNFDSSTTNADPGSGDLRLDNAVYASVTNIFISQTTLKGLDATRYLETIEIGDIIYLQDHDDATKYVRFEVSNTLTDNGTWWTIPVTFVNSGGALFSNNDDLMIAVMLSGAASGSDTNFAADDLTFTGDRLHDLGGNSLRIQGGGNDLFRIDPTVGSENSFIGTYNTTGASNQSYLSLTNSNTQSGFVLQSDFNGGADVANIIASAASGSSIMTFSAGTLNMDGDTLPLIDDTYDLGSPTFQWKDLYLTGASIYMAGHKILASAGLTLPTGGAVRTNTSAGNTLLLQAYDVDGTAYVTFGTLTANNTPTFDLSAAVTIGGNAIADSSDHLGFFAPTTSAQLAGVLSDETGTGGGFVRATAPSMASITLAAGTSSAGTAPLYKTAGTNLATPVSGAEEFDGTTFYSTTASGRGVAPSMMFSRQTSNNSLSDVNTVQAVFASGQDTFTAQGSTTYLIRGVYSFTHGAVSHSVGLSFELGGGCTLTSILYTTMCWVTALNTNTASQTTNMINQATNTAVNAAGANATEQITFWGHISVNAGGTITPSVTFSAAPGGAPATVAGSYIEFIPIGSNTVQVVGNIA